MIKIMKIIQTIEMKVTTRQTNTCSKSAIEKRFWCRFSYGYFTLCSGVFNVNFEHVIVHSVVIFHHKYEVFMFYMH